MKQGINNKLHWMAARLCDMKYSYKATSADWDQCQLLQEPQPTDQR